MFAAKGSMKSGFTLGLELPLSTCLSREFPDNNWLPLAFIMVEKKRRFFFLSFISWSSLSQRACQEKIRWENEEKTKIAARNFLFLKITFGIFVLLKFALDASLGVY